MIILDYKDRRPIYEQIIEKLEELMLLGVLKENDPMPSVRSLATDLAINPNTIQRAYAELERRGCIYVIKGKGSFVAENRTMKENKKKELLIHVSEIIDEAIRLGIPDQEIKHMVEIQYQAAKKYGAIFLIGIGAPLSNGEPHDGRAPDYDDWITPNSDGFQGLNGDILLWDDILETPFELSSMGIRVSPKSLMQQLEARNCTERTSLTFHRTLLAGELPLSIGGGIGQSRLCMFLLQKAHIGEVQASIWPEEQIETCRKHGIMLV